MSNTIHLELDAETVVDVLSVLEQRRKDMASELLRLDARIALLKGKVSSARHNGVVSHSPARRRGRNERAIIEFLKIHPEGKTQREIAEGTQIGRSSVNLVINRAMDQFRVDENGRVFLK